MTRYCQSSALGIINSYITYLSIYATKIVTDKRLFIDISIIRKILDRNEISQIEWTEAHHQISDYFLQNMVLLI